MPFELRWSISLLTFGGMADWSLNPLPKGLHIHWFKLHIRQVESFPTASKLRLRMSNWGDWRMSACSPPADCLGSGSVAASSAKDAAASRSNRRKNFLEPSNSPD